MGDQPDRVPPPPAGFEPTSEVLAELDRLNDACLAAPGEIEPQIALWKAVTALDYWFCINRGTPEDARPYSLASQAGDMVCIFSTTARAKAAADAAGLYPAREPVPLFVAPLPGAMDWAMAFADRGLTGITIDYPQLGAWCPLPNLAQLREIREQ